VTLAVAAVVVAIDQATKALVLQVLPVGAEWPTGVALARWFAVHHVRNTGMAFGLGEGRGEMFLAIALVMGGVLIAWAASAPPRERLLRATLGLIVGGALGNAIDRARFGSVIDFIDVRFWPVFNAADSAISIGVVLLAWHSWRAERAPSGIQAPAPDG